jgi:DNA polymerase I
VGTERIFLLDGHSLSYRAFFALPTDLATSTGQITNAVYGFTSMLIKLLTEERPDYIAVAFDKGPPTIRLERFADYKAQREESPDEFRQQMPLIREVLETLRIPIVEVEDHEADDAIATLALRAAEGGMEAVVVTADRDFFQLVRPGVKVMFNRKGISDIVLYDEGAVEERFGLPPEKYVEYVALKGDPSDNIPGVPGVGEKTATRLIQEHGSVEAVLANAESLSPKLRAGILEAGDDLVRNKDVARLVTDLDVRIEPRDCRMGRWDRDAVRRLFNSLEFRSLLERLEEVGTPGPAVAPTDMRQTPPIRPSVIRGLEDLTSEETNVLIAHVSATSTEAFLTSEDEEFQEAIMGIVNTTINIIRDHLEIRRWQFDDIREAYIEHGYATRSPNVTPS